MKNLVREDVDSFTRGSDPYRKMGLGSHRPKTLKVPMDPDELHQGTPFEKQIIRAFNYASDSEKRILIDSFPGCFNEHDMEGDYYKMVHEE